jgi:hypothetical protein
MSKEWNLSAFRNDKWNIHLGEQDPLDFRSYSARVNLEEENRSKGPKLDLDDDYY